MLTLDFLNDYIQKWGTHPANIRQEPFFDAVFHKHDFPGLGLVKLCSWDDNSDRCLLTVSNGDDSLQFALYWSNRDEAVRCNFEFVTYSELVFKQYLPSLQMENRFIHCLKTHEKMHGVALWDAVLDAYVVQLPGFGVARFVSFRTNPKGHGFVVTISVEHEDGTVTFHTVNGQHELGRNNIWRSDWVCKPVVETSIKVVEC